MRSGGEADKLANRYEGLWTTYQLFDVLRGEALSLTPEPLEEGVGVEFHKMLPSGVRESHSVKIQTPYNGWTLTMLTRLAPNGRSFLGDLIGKTMADPAAKVYFVSEVTANSLRILCDEARRSPDAATFRRYLDVANARFRQEFQAKVLPLCGGQEATAWDQLRRIQVSPVTLSDLTKNVERDIAREFYRHDGEPLDVASVRRLLAEFILESLRQEVDRPKILARLHLEQIGETDWARDRNIRQLVEERNRTYLRHVRDQLINGEAIRRGEAAEAFVRITEHHEKFGIFVGVAGLGKSCATAELLERLIGVGIPCLALRMDVQTDELTARGLGRKLSLPTSPVDVLAGMAEGGLSVLVIDQLDALSMASGRNQNLWVMFEDLLEEVRSYPNLKVWLACRLFDLEHDYRLRNLVRREKAHRISIAPLDLEQVKIEIRRANVDPGMLGPKQLEMLQTPMHLSLYLESEPAGKTPFQTVQELYDRYWDRKRDLVAERLGRSPYWNQVIDLLCEQLTKGVGASADLIEDAYTEDARFMASAHVIVKESFSYRFFYEGFFDYAFGRRFVLRGRNLLNDLLLLGDQGLAVRGPVRQVLTYLRTQNWTLYLTQLNQLLTDPRVRAHIHRLILDWMSTLPDPMPEEAVLLSSMSPETLEKLARSVPFNSVPWFDLLDKLGLFEHWLTSDSMEQLQYLLWLFGAPNIAQHRSARVAALTRSVLAGGGERRRQILRLFNSCEIHHSREFFDLFLELLKEGAFDSGPAHRWMNMDDLGSKKPEMTAELIAQCLDRLVELANSAQMQSPFDVDVGWLQLPESMFDDAARLDPTSFVRHVLPRVIRLIKEHEMTTEDGRVLDRVWPYRSVRFRHDFRELVFEALCDAMGRLATTNPALLDDYTRGLESLPHQNAVSLLLSAWAANGLLFSNRVIDYLLAAPHRLDLGYSSWGGGNGKAAISRGAINAVSVHCDEVHFRRIENAILLFYPPFERQQPKRLGYTQYLLLDSLAELRRSDDATRRIQELARKFPGVDLEMPSAGDRDTLVRSPIPGKAVKKMSDDQWLSAMRAYPRTEARRANVEDFLKGGSVELSQQLEAETKRNKPRFAALALRMEADIQPVYFEAVLRGLVASDERQSSLPTEKARILPVETSAAVEVIVHIHRLFGTKIGRWISHAIAYLAERELPNDLLDMVANFAQYAPDPEQELWQTSTVGEPPLYAGDPLTYGINTTRGAAARAIAQLLFEDEHRFDRLKAGALAVISDQSLAVRACAVECLLAMLNFEPELAVGLFLKSLREAGPILRTMCVRPFLYHAVFSHYGVLRELLLTMLRSPDADVRETAAQQIALASFGTDEAKADLVEVFSGDEVCRAAVARVDAENLHDQECMPASRARLKDIFSDESPKVRKHAAQCFRRISDEQLCQESELIDAFLQSPAFQHNANMLLMALKDSVARLPDVVCRIPERAVELHRSSSSNEARWWTNQMAPLVLRLHEQTIDPVIKRRCLDVIDAMIELDFGSVSFELAKLES